MRLGRPWGGGGAGWWNFASGWGRVASYAPPFAGAVRLPGGGYQWSLKPAAMLLLLVVWPKSVTAVVTCNGP